MAILSILSIPIRIIRIPFSIALLAIGFKHRRNFNLPCAGIDENKAQSIYFALTQAASTEAHKVISQSWIQALQVVQVASGRVLSEINIIDTNLQFWTGRLQSGNHVVFTLLKLGPANFFHRILKFLRIRRAQNNRENATVRQRRSSTTSIAAQLVEKRILILRLLRSELCEAASAIQNAGAILYLQQQLAISSDSTSTTTTATMNMGTTMPLDENDALFPHAQHAIEESMLTVINAFNTLNTAVNSTLELQQEENTSMPSQDRPMIKQALNKVLGVSRIRRILTPPAAVGDEKERHEGSDSENEMTTIIDNESDYNDDDDLVIDQVGAGDKSLRSRRLVPSLSFISPSVVDVVDSSRRSSLHSMAHALKIAQRRAGFGLLPLSMLPPQIQSLDDLETTSAPPSSSFDATPSATPSAAAHNDGDDSDGTHNNRATTNRNTVAVGVHTVLFDARKAIALLQNQQHSLVKLPRWILMPSQAQQHWIQYTFIGASIAYGAFFLIRHSPLVGSKDLECWIQNSINAIHSAWEYHIIDPLQRVRGELFDTFRRRPAIVSMQEYVADRDSLQRMLDDFERDYIKRRGAKATRVSLPSKFLSKTVGAGQAGVDSASTSTVSVPSTATASQSVIATPSSKNSSTSADPSSSSSITPTTSSTTTAAATDAIPPPGEEVMLQGMELMMRSYENELREPIKNLVSGDLMRSLLIQVQKLKVDTESAMLEIDQILRANELSISLVAAVPAFAFAGAGLYGIGRLLTPAPLDPRREAVSARIAMIEVERALESLAVLEESQEKERETTEEQRSERQSAIAEAHGMAVYRLALAFSEAESLFLKHRGLLTSAGDAEWPNLRADLLELAVPASAVQKLRTAQRMMRVYAIYQQF